MDKQIKVRHIRDYKNPARVLTIVTRKEDDGTVTYGYAMNKPSGWTTLSESEDYIARERVKGDQFSRAKGREIALGRMQNPRTRCNVEIGEQPPLEAVLQDLLHDRSDTVRRIAADELSWRTNVNEYQRYLAEIEQAEAAREVESA